RLGDLLGEPARGAEWARYAQGILDDVAARVMRIPPARRPRVYYGRGPHGLSTGLAGSINMESIERVGATNVAAALGPGGLVQVSVEQVLAWNPDVIVTIDRNFYANVWRDPLWQGLAAVRSGKVFLSPNVPFGWIDFPPSLNRLLGLRWLARTLYPEAFPEDLRPFVRDFYTRAYHQTPTSEQLDTLVRTAEPRRG
ncbi:MAG: ABC transporter substrate-binding protein, partial [Burkholderiales bacterium]